MWLRYGEESLPLLSALEGAELVSGEEPPALPDVEAATAGALSRPLGHPSLDRFIEPGDRVAIVVEGSTRQISKETVLPLVEDAARRAGASSLVRLEPRDGADPMAYLPLGWTSFGVARLHGDLMEADKIVLLSTPSFHYLAGFGGGGMLLAQGCGDPATAEAILGQAFVSGGLHFKARAGVVQGNPVQRAIAEVLALAPPSFLVELTFQRGGRPSAVFAGDTSKSHEAACAFLRKWHLRHLAVPYDCVIVSPGGAPFDRNLIEAYPSLDAAFQVVRPGGAIVLAAACTEGPGSPAFAAAVERHPRLEDQERELRSSFSTPSYIAWAMRRMAREVSCILVSEGVDPALATGLGLHPAKGLEEAVELARTLVGDGTIGVLQEGARVLALAPGSAADALLSGAAAHPSQAP